jgi:2-C-methyl-D-erythritol 4-phosphate cytidylyltransferase
MKKYALIVAGGSGSRMKTFELKQFIPVAGKPLLMHTLERFIHYDPAIPVILVLPGSHHDHWKELCEISGFTIPHILAEGGKTRFHSVQNGLSCIHGEGIVFIHDGVRPFVTSETLQRCYDTAMKTGNAIPVVPVSESIRQVGKKGNFPVNRDNYVLIQTPQTFRISLIKSAYQCEYSPEFTDDASVLEKAGETIHLVEGNRENIKITWPEDLIFARSLLESTKNNLTKR